MKKIDQLSKYPGIIIYGAGRIGEQVFALLEGLNLESKIKAFAVSDELKFSQKFEIKVEKIDNLKPCYKSALFIIAVAGDSRDDVIKKCGELGIKHYVTVDQLFVDGKTPDEFIVKGLEYKEKESGHCSKKYATHMTVCI